MQTFDLKTYLIYAIYIVRTNPLILLFLTAVGLLNGITVYFPESAVADLVSTFTILSAIFISPVIYGMYYEIVEDRYSSLANIFRTYVMGYLLVLVAMYVPIIFTTAMVISSAGGAEPTGTMMLIILFFSLLFLYVVPAYYISGRIIDSIVYGVRFFFKHAFSSAPLLLMALTAELLLLLSHYQLGTLREVSPLLFIIAEFLVYMTASIIDFLLFIMLVYILRVQEDIPKRQLPSP